MSSAKIRSKKLRDNRREKSLCVLCGAPSQQYYCLSCKNKKKYEREKFKVNRICTVCKTRPASGGCLCDKCLDNRKKQREEKVKNGCCCYCLSPTEKGVVCSNCKETKNKLYFKRKTQKLCVICGKNQVNESLQCSVCILKRQARIYLGSSSKFNELNELLINQNEICPYTGKKIKIGVDAVLDHIVPKSKGGSNELNNLQWVYKYANFAKSDMSEQDFLNFIKVICEYRGL